MGCSKIVGNDSTDVLVVRSETTRPERGWAGDVSRNLQRNLSPYRGLLSGACCGCHCF